VVTPVDAHIQGGAELTKPAPISMPEVGVAQTRLGHPTGGGSDAVAKASDVPAPLIVASTEAAKLGGPSVTKGERLEAPLSVFRGRK